MQYNTQMKKLVLPEYGRNIQMMVDHCVAIKDSEKRKKCAYAIINIMGNMFPHLRDVNDFKHILWDHLAIMSDFKLDIEFPYEIITKEELNMAPGHLEYSRPTMRFRHYGKILENMVRIAADMEPGEKRDYFIKLLLGQMKKSYIQWNKDVEDEKIIHDIREISGGKIVLDAEKCVIPTVRFTMPHKEKLKNIKSQRRK